ncbi:MAG: hypothetical protein A2Y33_12575 [Spirochaetes bacterium GWF1_51_8]|nr:MAG: hypothetical protein A2Y33_12575 [Spirochaetes bacterium GWF1_51_8]
MKRVSALLFVVLISGTFAVSCAPADVPAGPLTLSGTITVPNVSYWTNIKIGMIAAPTNDDGSAASDLSTTSSGISSNRVYLWHNLDNTTNNFKPTYFGAISGTGTTKDYAITIDTWDNSKAFYFVVWFDKNLDSNMNLIDATTSDNDITNSEVNTLCWRQVSSDMAVISTVFASKSGSKQMYKFNGYAPGSSVNYLYQEIKDDMKTGWNFYILTNTWTK